ncbi:MAG: hypothetical protein NTX41_06915 [Verrucomicrobia bacterium]|nr:hypothetical protein [Verrucomicrobiota bacterium]
MAFPILVIALWFRVASLEAKVARLTSAKAIQSQPSVTAAETPPPFPAQAVAAAVAPAVVPTVASPVVTPIPATPRPLVSVAASSASKVAPQDPWEDLREMGLLPPADLKGEYALGSWWAVRVGGALAVASVVFLAIWLNLRSTLPAWVRLGEILALGGLGLWGGHRLEQSRRDLGRVVFAVGLTVFQFAAWASFGMEKMRVLETPAQAAVLQFFVALIVGGVALARKDKLIGQISIIFATVATGLSVQAGSDALTIGVEAGSIAALGAVLLSRGGWASSAVLGLVGSLLGLLILYDGRPSSVELTAAIQLGAGLAFLSLWFADLLGRVASSFDEAQKNTFLCAAFFGPAVLSISVAVGGDNNRAIASLIVAVFATVVGFVELRRRRVAAEIILTSALVFAAAAGAWKVEQRLVWAVWIVAAALTQLIYTRTRSAALIWVAEGMAAAAVFAYLNQSPTQPWMRLLAPVSVAALAAWRFSWGSESATAWNLRRTVSLLALGLLVCFVQSQFPLVDQPWAWLVVLPIAALFREPKLLWAILPAFVWTHLVVLTSHLGSNPGGIIWPMWWALALVVLDAAAVWFINILEHGFARFVQGALAFVSAVLLLKALAAGLNLPSPPVPDAGRAVALWLGGIALVAALAEGYHLLTNRPTVALVAQVAFLPAFVVLATAWAWSEKFLALTPLWLAGLALALYGLARSSVGLEQAGLAARALVCAGLGLIVFIYFDALPGAGVSLLWALAAALVFILGFVLKTRSYRMLGIVGLVIATGHVILFDVHDILGRIVACAAVAVAFFGVAWLYGKVVKSNPVEGG